MASSLETTECARKMMEVEEEMQFEVQGVLARGASATIELWISTKIPKRKYAFKKFLFDDANLDDNAEADNKRKEAECLKEINILSKLRDRNIMNVLVVRAVRTSEYCGFLMPYCEDGTLNSVISSLTVADTRKFSQQISRGVEYLHINCVIHGDLKPTNILIHRGTAIISDFGLSIQLPNQSVAVRIRQGTTDFRAPETYEDKPVNPFKVDVYALGITFWCMATKESPHFCADLRAALDHLSELPHLPQGYSKIVKTLISRDPSKRPTVSQILLEL